MKYVVNNIYISLSPRLKPNGWMRWVHRSTGRINVGCFTTVVAQQRVMSRYSEANVEVMLLTGAYLILALISHTQLSSPRGKCYFIRISGLHQRFFFFFLITACSVHQWTAKKATYGWDEKQIFVYIEWNKEELDAMNVPYLVTFTSLVFFFIKNPRNPNFCILQGWVRDWKCECNI